MRWSKTGIQVRQSFVEKTLIMGYTVLRQSIDSEDYLMFSFGSSVQVR